MADNITRAGIFRLNSRKVADVGNVTFSGESNNKPMFGANGYLGHTDGATTTKFAIKQVLQISGADVDLMGLVINKTRVTLEFFAAGILYQVQNAVPMDWSIDSSTEDGSLIGSFNYEGGPPVSIGN